MCDGRSDESMVQHGGWGYQIREIMSTYLTDSTIYLDELLHYNIVFIYLKIQFNCYTFAVLLTLLVAFIRGYAGLLTPA